MQDASVTLRGPGRPTQTLNSGSDGSFAFGQVIPGRYSLEVRAAGFTPWARSELTLAAEHQAITVTLDIAGITESVEVMGRTASPLSTPTSTGSRLGLTSLETPASVQVVSGETIRARGDVTLDDTDNRLVGVTNTIAAPGSGGGGGGGGRTARGFLQTTTVMKLYDGTQLFVGEGTVTFPFDTWNIDRVEMLGGPASVMYGTGSIGGAINVVPRRPSRERFEHSARLGTGSHGNFRGGIDSTGPLGPRVSYRVAASHNRSDGWIDRGDSRSSAASGVLRIGLGSSANFSLSHDWGTQSPTDYEYSPLINGEPVESIRKQNYNVLDANHSFTDRLSQLKFEWAPSSRVVVHSGGTIFNTDRLWRGAPYPLYQVSVFRRKAPRVFKTMAP